MTKRNYSLTAQYIIVIILYIVAYIYSIHFAVTITGRKDGTYGKINNMHESCIIGCPSDANILTQYRGKNYYIGGTDGEKQSMLNSCLATFWSFSHFLLYSAIGFLAPDLFWDTFFIGVMFEAYESWAFDCHDLMDIVYNTSGFIVGRYLRACTLGG